MEERIKKLIAQYKQRKLMAKKCEKKLAASGLYAEAIEQRHACYLYTIAIKELYALLKK